MSAVYVRHDSREVQIYSKRINEFNVEATLALFLPYHESPHFAKMITILHIQYVITLIFLLYCMLTTFLKTQFNLEFPSFLQICWSKTSSSISCY